MTKPMNEEERFEARDRARWKADDKAYARLCRRMDKAENQIGELCRDGQQVFYVFPVGGKYHEGTQASLIDYLIRNRFV